MNRKILVIDDELIIQALIKKILQPKDLKLHDMASDVFGEAQEPSPVGFDVDTASQGEEGLELVSQAVKNDTPYAMAFIDMRMPPGWDGATTAQKIREVDPEIQIVFVTAYSDKKADEIYQQLGGSDRILYVKKPFEPDEIRFIAENLSQTYDREKNLKRMASFDGLTNVYNRRYFIEQFKRELERVQRYDKPLSLGMIDIDHFKKVNDTYGHPAGDAALKLVAECCMDSLRKIDLCGRYGGEEFVVLLPESETDSAYQVFERLRLNIEALPVHWQDHSFGVTVSIGYTKYKPDQEDTVDSMIERADKALYTAKEKGRNCIEHL